MTARAPSAWLRPPEAETAGLTGRTTPLGFTLAEVMISILITAIAVMSVFSIQLAVRAQTKKTAVRETATGFNRELQESLKNYVRPADLALVQQSLGLPGSPAWHLPGDTCQDCSLNCWALESVQESPNCTHNATSMLPDEFKNPPSGTPPGKSGKMTYTVALETLSNGEQVRKVTAKVVWTEMQE